MFGLIGDIHGHADELEALLKKMGYFNSKDRYAHSDKKVIYQSFSITTG